MAMVIKTILFSLESKCACVDCSATDHLAGWSAPSGSPSLTYFVSVAVAWIPLVVAKTDAGFRASVGVGIDVCMGACI
jgi:hypothetical protein